MSFDVNDLPASTSHYDGCNTLYYRGDGLRAAVSLPEGKTVVRISHHYDYKVVDNVVCFVGWLKNGDSYSKAIPNGELVTITLKDAD